MSDLFSFYDVSQGQSLSEMVKLINDLPVKLLDFALISEMRHRVYGVKIWDSSEGAESCCLNRAARQALWRELYKHQQWLLSDTSWWAGAAYIEETFLVQDGQNEYETDKKPIEAVNVIKSMEYIDTFPISPFTQLDVTVQHNGVGQYYEAVFDATISPDPDQVVLRNRATYAAYRWQKAVRPIKSGGNWIMALQNTFSDIAATYDLQDIEYMIVDIDPIVGATINSIVACHVGHQQVLPFAKPPIVTSNNKWRFYFFAWSMGRPEFDKGYIDLAQGGEFHKLYDEVDFYIVSEEHQIGSIYIDNIANDDPDTVTTAKLYARILDSYSGRVSINEVTGTEGDYTYSTVCVPYGQRYKAKIYYKINPLTAEMLKRIPSDIMRAAISAKAAAQVNIETCNCKCESRDYIMQMQVKHESKFVSPTGVVVTNYKFGNREGDKLFAEMLNQISTDMSFSRM